MQAEGHQRKARTLEHRLEVLDATASAMMHARALGPMTPMRAEVIEELVAAFPGI